MRSTMVRGCCPMRRRCLLPFSPQRSCDVPRPAWPRGAVSFKRLHTSPTATSTGTSALSHITAEGQPGMVDVSHKAVTSRTATASSLVLLPPNVSVLFSAAASSSAASAPSPDLQTAKGPVFATAILAGTLAVKQTGHLIPLCHPLVLDGIAVRIRHEGRQGDGRVRGHNALDRQLQEGWTALVVECDVRCSGKTGVEMEALTGATVAALTCYDMLKAVSHRIVIADTRLVSKRGGKSDYNTAPTSIPPPSRAQQGDG